jgi:ketosteroid isomerase-like protein
MLGMSAEHPIPSERTREHPKATAYRQAADAFRAGDLAAMGSMLDPDVVWHVPGDHPLVGELPGPRGPRAISVLPPAP